MKIVLCPLTKLTYLIFFYILTCIVYIICISTTLCFKSTIRLHTSLEVSRFVLFKKRTLRISYVKIIYKANAFVFFYSSAVGFLAIILWTECLTSCYVMTAYRRRLHAVAMWRRYGVSHGCLPNCTDRHESHNTVHWYFIKGVTRF